MTLLFASPRSKKLGESRDRNEAGTCNTKLHPPSYSWSTEHRLNDDVEMKDFSRTSNNATAFRRLDTTPPSWNSGCGPESSSGDLPPRYACTPITKEAPIRFCKCRCHAGGIGRHRFSRVLLHDTIKPLLYLASAGIALTMLTAAPTIAFFPTIIRYKIPIAFFSAYLLLWVLCNVVLLGLILIRRGPWLRRGLKIVIAANAFLIVWFLAALTVLALPLWQEEMRKGLVLRLGGDDSSYDKKLR